MGDSKDYKLSGGGQLDLFSWKPKQKKISSNLSDYSKWTLRLIDTDNDSLLGERKCTPIEAKKLFENLPRFYFEDTSDNYDYNDDVESFTLIIEFSITSPEGKSYSCYPKYSVDVFTKGWYDPGSAWGYGEDPPDGGSYAKVEFSFDKCDPNNIESDFDDEEQEEILWGILKTFMDQYGKELDYIEDEW